jgi:hypothetical protein
MRKSPGGSPDRVNRAGPALDRRRDGRSLLEPGIARIGSDFTHDARFERRTPERITSVTNLIPGKCIQPVKIPASMGRLLTIAECEDLPR